MGCHIQLGKGKAQCLAAVNKYAICEIWDRVLCRESSSPHYGDRSALKIAIISCQVTQ